MIPTIATGRPRPRHWLMKGFEPYAALKTGAGPQKDTPGGAETRESARDSFRAAAAGRPGAGPETRTPLPGAPRPVYRPIGRRGA